MKNLSGFLASTLTPLVAHVIHRFARSALIVIGMSLFVAAQTLIAVGNIKGTSVEASTDLNGSYSIPNAPSGDQTIVVSYIADTYLKQQRCPFPEGG